MAELYASERVYGIDDMAAAIDGIQCDLERLGIQLPPAGRHRAAMTRISRALEKGDVVIPASLDDTRLGQQAIIDIYNLSNILTNLGSDAQWQPRIEIAAKGAAVPWQDSNDVARNTEYELYWASLLKKAGYRVNASEPDIQVDIDGWTVGVAVKRLASEKKLVERVAEGAKQLQRAKRPGFVCIDASIVCLERNEFRVNMAPAEAHKTMQLELTAVARESEYKLRSVMNDWCFGMIMSATAPVLAGNPVGSDFTLVSSRLWLSPDENDPRAGPFGRFAKRMWRIPLL